MSLLTQTIEPVALDVSNQADWYIEIEDTDEETGNPISHAGEVLTADLRAHDGTLLFTMASGGYISLKPGFNNIIVIRVPWSVSKTVEGGEYETTLVRVISSTSREEVLPLLFRQSIGPTTT